LRVTAPTDRIPVGSGPDRAPPPAAPGAAAGGETGLRGAPAEETSDGTPPRRIAVELIIPSCNRLSRLYQTLVVVRTLYPEVPICLALQGEQPAGGFADCIAADPHLRVEAFAEPNVVGALNASIATSAADVILLLDDDALPAPGWMEAHLAALAAHPEAPYTCGREVNAVHWRPVASELTRIAAEAAFGLFLSSDKKICSRIVGWTNRLGFQFGNFFLPGQCLINSPMEGNLAVRRAAFLAAGGFNSRYRGNAWSFGPEFGLRLARTGGGLGRYVGEAVIIHQPYPTGGSRQASRRQWYADYVFNNRVFIETVGVAGWLGAMPRLVKRYFYP
jgi:Glycosyl transferase family 2